MRTRSMRSLAGVAAIAVLLVACSGSDDDAAPSESGVPAETAVSSTAPDPTETTVRDDAVDVTAADSIATIPDGVPGLESDDLFCRSWSEFGGTFQALATASNFASDPVTAVRAEVGASVVLVDAVDTMRANVPSEVADESEQFLEELLGPLTRRAARAQQELLDAGLTSAQIDALGAIWLSTLAESGLGDPDIVFDVPAETSAGFDEAVGAFESGVPPIASDPSLVTNVEAPETQEYIAANCPDQGILGGNDFVGD